MAVLLIEFADRREVRRASAVRSSPLCEMTIAMALLGFFYLLMHRISMPRAWTDIQRHSGSRQCDVPPPNLRYI